MKLLLAFLSLAVFVALATDRPVIGILDQPVSDSSPQKTYIAASYVKWIEAGGARVIPLHYQDVATLKAQAQKLNGILFTGGGADLTHGSPFWQAGKALYQAALDINNNGGYLPIWGTCMGFQFLSVLTADEDSVLVGDFDSENLPIPLNFTRLAASSRLFASAPPEVVNGLASKPITMNNHMFGVTPQGFNNNPKLTAFFNVLSTNVDRNGREFISTFEAKKYPFYGVQWHPEKNPWEWTTQESIPHSPIGVRATLWTAEFFVNEARKSTASFTEQELQDLLIYNFNPVFTNPKGSNFTQQYYWGA